MQEIKEHFIDKFCGKTEDGGLFLEPIYLAMPLELFNWIATEVSQLQPQVMEKIADLIKDLEIKKSNYEMRKSSTDYQAGKFEGQIKQMSLDIVKLKRILSNPDDRTNN